MRATLLALSMTLPLTAFAAAPSPELMQKLAANEAQLQHLYDEGDYHVTTKYQTLDPATGAVKLTNDMETRMFRKDGKPWEEITKFVEGGKDVTAAHAAQREKEVRDGKRKRADGVPFRSPFSAAEQPKYRFNELPAAEPGKTTIAFEPITATKDTQVGTALVDVATATARHMEFHPAIKPNFVHKLDMVLELVETPAGWALGTLVVDAEGGLFFVKKRVHVESKIEGYELPAGISASR